MSITPHHPELFDSFKNTNETFRSYPDRKIIAQVTDSLLDLLFSDVRLGSVGSADIATKMADTAKEVFHLLAGQAEIAFRHLTIAPAKDHQESITALFDTMQQIRQKILEDMQAAYQGDPAARGPDEVILSYPTYVAVAAYRLAHELQLLGLPLIPRMMTEYAHRETGIDIHPGADIGRAFFIDHGTGVVIGETANIGNRVRLYQGVTLGAFNFPRDERGELIRGQKRHPTIEDDVSVFANATILGGDTVIGARSVIGSNVWLTKSVAPDSIVTMEEPRLKIRPKN